MSQPNASSLDFSWPARGIALARFTRPEQMNTLTIETLKALDRAVDEAEAAGCRAFIVTGSGRAFCGGAHVSYFTEPDPVLAATPLAIRDRYVRRIQEVFDRLQAMPFVTIAAINGYALGGGCELALSCDFRLIAESARIGLTEVRFGTIPGAGGVQNLPKIVGRAKALEITLLGEHLTAAQALAAGMVTATAADATLLDDAFAFAARFTKFSPVAVAEAKRAIYRCQTENTAAASLIALDGVTVAAGSADWQEGMSAFGEKRAPRFEP